MAGRSRSGSPRPKPIAMCTAADRHFASSAPPECHHYYIFPSTFFYLSVFEF